MKNFTNRVLQFIQQELMIRSGNRVLVACSGGVDSVALLHFLSVQSEKLNIEVAAAHVDHMLRGAESRADCVLVESLCEKLNIPFFSGSVPVPEMIEREGGNVQAICREGRYAFFEETMHTYGYDVLATAHHAEDQFETVLMQVTKGSTPTGIPIQRELINGMLVRPFLLAKKEELYAYVEANQLPHHEDISNTTDKYMRNRYRRHIIPLILKENASATENIFTMAKRLQEDELFLVDRAKQLLEKKIVFTDEALPSIESSHFNDMPTALQRRCIQLLLGYLYGGHEGSVHFKSELIELLLHHLRSNDGNVSIDLPLGYQFLREYDKLTFIRKRKNVEEDVWRVLPEDRKVNWVDGSWIYWAEIDKVTIELLSNAKDVVYFNLPSEVLPLYVRKRKEGDRLQLPGMHRPKRLSRIFIDEKVNRSERDCLPIVVTKQDEICAVPGIRYGEAFTQKRTANSKYIFILGKN